MTANHVPKYNGLNRYHKEKKLVDEFIEKYRPKVIREYEENGVKIKVYGSV